MSRQRAGLGAVLLRTLPRQTVMHRLWAGTKIIAALALTLTVSLFPGWPSLAVGALAVTAGALLARVPVSVLPRVPWWFWATMAVGAALALLGSGLVQYLLFLGMGWILMAVAMIIGWSTPIAQVAPAMSTLLAPARAVGLPVGEWVVTISLAVRALPLLAEELRIVIAARRLRAAPPVRSLRATVVDGVGVLSAAMSAAVRRAADVGRAIEARGGMGQVSNEKVRLRWADAFALIVVAGLCVSIVLLSQRFPSGY